MVTSQYQCSIHIATPPQLILHRPYHSSFLELSQLDIIGLVVCVYMQALTIQHISDLELFTVKTDAVNRNVLYIHTYTFL